MKTLAMIATASTAALILAGCSSSSKSSTTTSSAAAPASSSSSAPPATAASSSPSTSGSTASAGGITIVNFAYSGELTVKAGATVTVTNKDSAAHTLTDKVDKKFDTGNIPGNGGTGTFTAPSTPGTYKFGCTYHPNMAGTLIVTS